MKNKLRFLLFLLSLSVFINSFSQIPLVYNVESTDTGYAPPPLPTLANSPSIPLLPDPFKFANGTFSKKISDWEHHRSDFKALFENYEIGNKPIVDTSQVKATYAGGTLTVIVTVNGQTLTLTCAVSIPSGATAPYPVCIGMDNPYGSLNSTDFTSRGIVGITYSESQVTTYNNALNTDPFFKLYPNQNIDNTGQYAAWAWGVSRIIDGLYKLKAAGSLNVDLNHIAVTGCSYAGKMALFAGAFDERIALTIAQESGGGGATSWRYTDLQPVGTVEGIAQTNPSWFKNSMFDFSNPNVTKLPEDHHELMAMCAPRALYCTGNNSQLWLSNLSCYVCGMAAKHIYDSLGISDRFGFNVDDNHAHCAFPSDEESDVIYFLNKFMNVNGDTVKSQILTTHPAGYDTIDYAKWYSQWGPVAATGVSLNPTTVTFGKGDTTRLTAIFVPYFSTNKKVIWNSSNTSIVTVDSTGLLTAMANGTATVLVTTADGSFTASSAITVANVSVTGVSVSPMTDTIFIGAISQLTATLAPLHPTNKSITWSTSNAAVATVNAKGVVSGIAIGTATITVTSADGSFTATTAVTVIPSSPVNINVGGPATGSFIADKYFTGGSPYTNTNTITETQITVNPPPVAIFSTERYGSLSYTIPGRPLAVTQMVTLYFAETYVTAAGARLFDVIINNKKVLSSFDIWVSAGGSNKGIAKTFYVKADSLGHLVINVVTINQSPKFNGISVADSGSITAAYAGADQKLTDTENSGSVSVNLDGSGSIGSISSYVWKEGTIEIATGVKPTVSLTVGIHTITLVITDKNGNTATDDVIITVAGTSSIGEINNKRMSVYPNPVSKTLNITLSSVHSAISLYDISGQQLLNINTEDLNITIDMTKYRSGVYLLRISNSGQSRVEKIIKQ
jgi:uncharacterized protein YjdB